MSTERTKPAASAAQLPVLVATATSIPLANANMPLIPSGQIATQLAVAASSAPIHPPVAAASSASKSENTAATARNVPLGTLLAVEAACGVASASLVAPLISIVDKAIFSNASGKQPLFQAVVAGITTLATRPLYFVRQPSFLLILGVYGGTYIVANSTQALCDLQDVPWQFPKFVSSSVANVGLSVLKDLYFTRAFGTGPSRPVPAASYALYTARDCMTIFASFNMPSIIAKRLEEQSGLSHKTADTLAQLVTPCAVQFFSSSLHLFGMDLYNRPSSASPAKSAITWSDRATFIRREYAVTTMARIARIFPAFGIGGVTNKYLRRQAYAWMDTTQHH